MAEILFFYCLLDGEQFSEGNALFLRQNHGFLSDLYRFCGLISSDIFPFFIRFIFQAH
jgi:hypothetical protein